MRAQAKTCEAIKGVLEEGEEIIENYKDSGALDAGICSRPDKQSNITKYRATGL
jgi:ferritin-like metal-binding protein YciE